MKQINRRIYADKVTGQVLADTGEPFVMDYYIKPTVEDDFRAFKSLHGRDENEVILLELEIGQYARDFEESISYRVNPDTLSLEFSYPDPDTPEAPPIYQLPLTEQVAQLKAADLDNKEAIASLFEMMLTGGL
ncbi:hypothetical protein ACK8P5_00830 [Paenibacillus sp. EC2-1]|uniref:hypothetical protein n=1 Tax=Paenibacillus sp. EC2-1 TaxID=3388665 RepID=UPI003BEEFAC8